MLGLFAKGLHEVVKKVNCATRNFGHPSDTGEKSN